MNGVPVRSQQNERTRRPAVEFVGVTKTFPGAAGGVGLRELSLTVPAGVVAALVGPNGCGKTTALRIAATLVSPSRGAVRILGADCVREAHRVRRTIGLSLGAMRSFYWRLTAAGNLTFFAALRGVPAARVGRHVRELAEELGVAGALGAPA
ncbi:MAG: ATP-binding cassette domain-containing protein, partial [Candidatus Eisenbacteria bacterium]|nr:ATP-binding cassette domain-containing protein [Candidatus Eisenbacteria bacterium]